MKKILISLLTLSIVACGSGSSASANNTPPAPPVVNPIEVPTNFIPFGRVSGVSGSTTPLAYDQTNGHIAVPVNGIYTQYALPPTVNTALSATFTSTTQNDTQVSISGSNVILQIPSATLGAEPAIFVLTPIGSPLPTTIAVGGINANNASVIEVILNNTGDEVAGIQSRQFTLSSNTHPLTNIIINPNITVTQKTSQANLQNTINVQIPLTGCTGYTGTPSALQIADYSNTTYVGVGSSSGQVCVATVNRTDVVQSSWTSLTSGPNTAGTTDRYQAGNVNQLNFYPGNPTALYGYWNVKNSTGSNQVYRITGTTANTTPTSFWNTTISNRQTSSTFASSVQFSNVPSSVNSIYTDNNNNVYVGTVSGGSVYKLAPGNTQWSSTQLSTNEIGSMTLSPSSTGLGAIATIYNSSTGQSSVYSVN